EDSIGIVLEKINFAEMLISRRLAFPLIAARHMIDWFHPNCRGTMRASKRIVELKSCLKKPTAPRPPSCSNYAAVRRGRSRCNIPRASVEHGIDCENAAAAAR